METERVLEVSGADVEIAIAKGLIRLGANRDEVEVEVLDDGSRGLFGVGAREARVRLRVRGKAAQPSASPPPTPPSARVERARAKVSGKDEVETARSVLLELLDLLGVEKARVEVRRAEPAEGEDKAPLVLNARGVGIEALIGRRGETLSALQHITRLITSRELESYSNVVVDIDGFKARREQSLRRLAQRMADQALRTGRTVVLEPMPPHERRIIHIALRDHPLVTTQSVGEGERRKVTIIPHREQGT
ncbi:MAG: Jag N-terminal domain-containing protein [Anaerolineae bacterium]|nr:Jag N-terminal domain-containing protein [Anaerolineae bacterium]